MKKLFSGIVIVILANCGINTGILKDKLAKGDEVIIVIQDNSTISSGWAKDEIPQYTFDTSDIEAFILNNADLMRIKTEIHKYVSETFPAAKVTILTKSNTEPLQSIDWSDINPQASIGILVSLTDSVIVDYVTNENGYWTGTTNYRLASIYELHYFYADAGKSKDGNTNIKWKKGGYERLRLNNKILGQTSNYDQIWSVSRIQDTADYKKFKINRVSNIINDGEDFIDKIAYKDGGTIKDNNTNLVWQKCSMGKSTNATCSGRAKTTTWENANKYCKELTLAGRRWRLPDIDELYTIADGTKIRSSLDTIPVDGEAPYYWTSTLTVLGAPMVLNSKGKYKFTVALRDGEVESGGDRRSNEVHFVRCVRGVPPIFHEAK